MINYEKKYIISSRDFEYFSSPDYAYERLIKLNIIYFKIDRAIICLSYSERYCQLYTDAYFRRQIEMVTLFYLGVLYHPQISGDFPRYLCATYNTKIENIKFVTRHIITLFVYFKRYLSMMKYLNLYIFIVMMYR